MKKTDLARLQQVAAELEQINDNNINHLVSIFESTFSAIATSEPKIALSIIKQLNEQVGDIEQTMKERKENADAYVEKLAAHMPPMIEFEDETDNEDMN
jgi:prephenate dehydrogenase